MTPSPAGEGLLAHAFRMVGIMIVHTPLGEGLSPTVFVGFEPHEMATRGTPPIAVGEHCVLPKI